MIPNSLQSAVSSVTKGYPSPVTKETKTEKKAVFGTLRNVNLISSFKQQLQSKADNVSVVVRQIPHELKSVQNIPNHVKPLKLGKVPRRLSHEVSQAKSVAGEKILKYLENIRSTISEMSPPNLNGVKSLIKKGMISLSQMLNIDEHIQSATSLLKSSDSKDVTSAHEKLESAAHIYMEAGEVTKAFEKRKMAAEKISFPESHPLYDLSSSSKPEGKWTSGLDTGVVKQGQIRIIQRTEGEKTTDQVILQLSHHARNQVQLTLDALLTDEGAAAFISQLPANLKPKEGEVIISQVDDGFKSADGGDQMHIINKEKPTQALTIEFPGIGKVKIGNDKASTLLRNQVQVELEHGQEPGVALQQLHSMMAILGVGPVACTTRPSDEERLKIGLLFHTFFPRQAVDLETQPGTYSGSVTSYKKEVMKRCPEMKEVLKKYLEESPELLAQEEIYPGKTSFVIKDMADHLRSKGAVGLMCGVGHTITQMEGESGSDYSKRLNEEYPKVCDRIVMMLNGGAQSSRTRFEEGKFISGASSSDDFIMGGGDSAFSRMMTKGMMENNDYPKDKFPFSGEIQILWKLEATQAAGCYAHVKDSYGIRRQPEGQKNMLINITGTKESYAKRPNLAELAEGLEAAVQGDYTQMKKHHAKAEKGHDNEVMIKDRIPPRMMAGLVVESEEKAEILKEELRKANPENPLVKTDNGIEYLFLEGAEPVPLNDFIHIAGAKESFKAEFFGKQTV
jgi:hypothetical protein